MELVLQPRCYRSGREGGLMRSLNWLNLRLQSPSKSLNNQQFTKLRFEMQSNSQIRALSSVCILLILSDQLRPTLWATTEASVPEQRPGKSTCTHSQQSKISSPHQVISSSKYCGLINLPTPPPWGVVGGTALVPKDIFFGLKKLSIDLTVYGHFFYHSSIMV